MPEIKKVYFPSYKDISFTQRSLTPSQAIIVGAGPAGVAAAIRLTEQNNISCTVYEIRPVPTTIGGAVGIPANGLRLLHRLGVYNALSTRGSQQSRFVLHSSTQGGILAEGDTVPSEVRQKTGFGMMRIMRTDLVDVMLARAAELNIPIHFGKKIVKITDNEETKTINVTFSDGTTDTADILLGCDGIHSAVRTQYVDPGFEPEYSGIAGTGSILPLSSFPPEIAQDLQAMNITLTPEGAFLLVACTAAGDKIFSVFSREVPLPESGDTRDGWEEHRKKEVEGFKSMLLNDVLKDVYGPWGEVLKQVVNETSSVGFYPVYRLPLGGKWFRGRCLLLGDAAHAMQPHAGQGVSMAMEDVFLLSRLLKNEGAEKSLREVFEKFDHVRRPRVNHIHETAARNGQKRRKTSPWALWVKEWVIWAGFLAAKAVGKEQGVTDMGDMTYDIDEVEV